MLISAKIITTFFTVILLASAARRFGPRWAGVLAGFPLGSAITLYFIGYEQGAEYAADGAVYTLAGLCGCLVLVSTYWWASRRWPARRLIILPAGLGFTAFMLAGWPLQWLPNDRWINLAIIMMAIPLAHRLLGQIPESETRIQKHNIWQKPIVALAFRATAASISVLGITALAHWLDPSQAGVLAAFPVSFFPALIVLHLSYGAHVSATAVKHYPSGLGAMVVYVMCASYSYDYLSLNMGTLVALGGACLYLLAYYLLTRNRSSTPDGRLTDKAPATDKSPLTDKA